jgi:hypothetical protein
MRQHLERHHPKEFETLQRQGDSSKPTASGSGSLTTIKQLSIQESFEKVRKIPRDSAEHEEITKSITLFIAMDCLPIYTVAKPGFKQLIEKAFNSRYSLPSRNYFSDTTIPKLYNDTKGKILNELSLIDYLSATSDIWSSVGLYPYLSLTVHYISDDWKLTAKLLETYPIPEDHTGENICDAIQDIFELWNIAHDKLVSITDSAANMKLASSKLDIPRIPCLGHIVHNAINLALSSDDDVVKAIAACKKISTKISTSWKKRRDLAKIQLEHNLPILAIPTECPTRWNAKMKLITYMLEQEVAIRDLLKDRDTVHLLPSAEKFKVKYQYFFQESKLLTLA